MKISKLYILRKYPFKDVWEKQKKSIIIVLSLSSALVGLGFPILWYLFNEKNYFGDIELISLNIIDFYLVIIGLIFVILIITLMLIPYVFKPFFLIIYNVYKKLNIIYSYFKSL